MSGRLQLITTPIGNMGELCSRAIDALRACNMIFAENTNTALRLLTACAVTGKAVRALHDGNETAGALTVADAVAHGQTIAYASEAGAPCVSDPGFRLVRECRKRGLTVEAIGIPSAFLNALIISGLPTDSFTFAGFPPPKSIGRQKFYTSFMQSEATVIFYESCHRLEKSLEDLRAVLEPTRMVSVCGELTKLHESCITCPIGELKIQTAPKGEWVIVVAKAGYEL